ncbi:MAG: hypothetical protein GY822_24550 [Deltaproteobacteria bacterium]|nr:hypothetical protein [Deltaproteobacteria bacterium]
MPTLSGCVERATPENTPGPPGCGLRDPSQTAQGMLSWAQQKWLKRNGRPSSVRANKHGGNDWLYQRNHGNQFGEEKSVEIYSFNAQGLLVGQDKEVEVFHGK